MTRYRSLESSFDLDRRELFRAAGAATAVAGGVLLGGVTLAEDAPKADAVETNIADFLAVPRGPHAIPGPFPGVVTQVTDRRCLVDDAVDAEVVDGMVEAGITRLTGRGWAGSARLFFEPEDVVGIKVNPVGPPLINARHEVVDAVIRLVEAAGVPRERIVIWDRFAPMLESGGYTTERYPGVQVEGLQVMRDGESFIGEDGRHISADNFDPDVYYYAKGIVGKGVRGYKDDTYYWNQHVFNGEYSYFGRLVTERITKIVNVAVFKNTGQAISMATKNLGFGAICNTGRLHLPLYLKVNTEVLAAPAVRDKLVLNIVDGIRGQYEDGPMKNEKFVYPYHTLYFATDPFAIDTVGHHHLVAKRKDAGIAVNENPRFTEYLRYGESLGLGVATPAKIALRREVLA